MNEWVTRGCFNFVVEFSKSLSCAFLAICSRPFFGRSPLSSFVKFSWLFVSGQCLRLMIQLCWVFLVVPNVVGLFSGRSPFRSLSRSLDSCFFFGKVVDQSNILFYVLSFYDLFWCLHHMWYWFFYCTLEDIFVKNFFCLLYIVTNEYVSLYNFFINEFNTLCIWF